MKVLFNVVAVLLVWQITSPARPRTCLAKAKDLCSCA